MNALKKILPTSRRRNIFLIPIAILFVVWLLLYLPHLRTSPAWYGDETLIHHTSRNLASGIATNLSLWATFWHPHYPYQPFYSFVNGIFARMAYGDIVGSRFFNAILALLCSLSLFLLGRKIFGLIPAFFCALMFLTYEQSIMHFRMSYAHNAVGLGFLLMTLFLLRPAEKRNDWLAGIGLLIAAGSHPLFIHGALTAFFCRIKNPRSWIRLFFPSLIYLIVSLTIIYLFFRSWLIEDLQHLKNSYLVRGASDGEGIKSLENFSSFIFQDAYHIFMLFGLLLCLPLKRYAAPIVGIIVLFLLVRNRQNLIPFYYQSIIILPVLCLGWAGLAQYVFNHFRRNLLNLSWIRCAIFTFPAILFFVALPKSISGTFITRNHYWVTQSTSEVESAAKWINEHTKPSDIVAGNSNIAWLLHAETVPYLQLITCYGHTTQGYENGNKRERFRFNAALENCHYAVVGDIDQRWAFFEPNVYILPQIIYTEKWPVVWSGVNYFVFENPRFSNTYK